MPSYLNIHCFSEYLRIVNFGREMCVFGGSGVGEAGWGRGMEEKVSICRCVVVENSFVIFASLNHLRIISDFSEYT